MDRVDIEEFRERLIRAFPLQAIHGLVCFGEEAQEPIARFRSDSEVLEFTVYCLCPGEIRGNGRNRWILVWRADAIAKTIALFDSAQRAIVVQFLRSVLASSELKDFHSQARFGLRYW